MQLLWVFSQGREIDWVINIKDRHRGLGSKVLGRQLPLCPRRGIHYTGKRERPHFRQWFRGAARNYVEPGLRSEVQYECFQHVFAVWEMLVTVRVSRTAFEEGMERDHGVISGAASVSGGLTKGPFPPLQWTAPSHAWENNHGSRKEGSGSTLAVRTEYTRLRMSQLMPWGQNQVSQASGFQAKLPEGSSQFSKDSSLISTLHVQSSPRCKGD